MLFFKTHEAIEEEQIVTEVILYTDKIDWHKTRSSRHLNEVRKHKDSWYKRTGARQCIHPVVSTTRIS